MKKSVYRIILLIAGLLHVAFFFFLPYAELKGMAGELGELVGELGKLAGLSSSIMPSKITGLAVLQTLEIYEDSLYLAMLMVPPAVLGLITALLALFGRKKLSYGFMIPVTLLMFPFYGVNIYLLGQMKTAGYSLCIGAYIFLLLTAAQFVFVIVGMVKDQDMAGIKQSASAAAYKTAKDAKAVKKDKTVKAGKKDGLLVILNGEYAGAEIPVSEQPVMIGRDPSSCSIVLKGSKISRKHCSISYNAADGSYTLTDYSINGTMVAGGHPEKLAEGKSKSLWPEDRFQVGDESEEIITFVVK